jgi:hypothetical protein
MSTHTQSCEIAIAKVLSSNLVLRDTASEFFDEIDALGCSEVTIDFLNVETITRSFAHEYMSRKRMTAKNTIEKNVPLSVQKMFAAIENSNNKPRFEELRSVQVINI